MAFVKLDNGIVIQKQQAEEDGFIQAPNEAVCGQVYANGIYSNPVIVKTPEQVKSEIQLEIDILEANQYMSRGEREAWILLLISTAAQQNVTQAQLYAANLFYKKVKDQDNAIKLLREKL